MTDSMPKVRPSSGTMGTINLPMLGSLSKARSMPPTKAVVVETARPFDPPIHSLKKSSLGATKVEGGNRRVRADSRQANRGATSSTAGAGSLSHPGDRSLRFSRLQQEWES